MTARLALAEVTPNFYCIPGGSRPRTRRARDPCRGICLRVERGRGGHRPGPSAPAKRGECLVITGYQDFLSSLSIVMREMPDIARRGSGALRIAFGINTATASDLAGRGRSVPDAARQHFLEQHGLSVADAADLMAVQAVDAIRAGRIDLWIFDPGAAASILGTGPDRRLHAKW